LVPLFTTKHISLGSLSIKKVLLRRNRFDEVFGPLIISLYIIMS
jgi:hypothetical protein